MDEATYVVEEIMNKASCLSLVCNAIRYWNTTKIHDIVESLRQQGEEIGDESDGTILIVTVYLPDARE